MVMGVDYQVSVGRECVVMGVNYQVSVVMGVDYQVRVWGGSVCGDGCGLSGESVGRECVVMGVDYQVSVVMGVDYQVRVWENVLKRVGGDQHELPDVSERV